MLVEVSGYAFSHSGALGDEEGAGSAPDVASVQSALTAISDDAALAPSSAGRISLVHRVKMYPLWLSYDDVQLEDEFQKGFASKFIRFAQIVCLLSALSFHVRNRNLLLWSLVLGLRLSFSFMEWY